MGDVHRLISIRIVNVATILTPDFSTGCTGWPGWRRLPNSTKSNPVNPVHPVVVLRWLRLPREGIWGRTHERQVTDLAAMSTGRVSVFRLTNMIMQEPEATLTS
jgi:hypothetical protein